MSQMLYFILQTPALRDLQLARICLPIECASSSQSYVPSSPLVQVSAMEARMNDILRKLQRFDTEDHRFIAFIANAASIHIVCKKAVVAKLFKTLFTQQRALGVKLVDVKSHVSLAPLDSSELQAVVSADVIATLQKAGWWGLGPGRLLRENILHTATATVRTTASLELAIDVRPPNTLALLLNPSFVRFHHPVLAQLARCDGDFAAASSHLGDSIVCVLPTLTPAILTSVRRSAPEEAANIHATWEAAALPLPDDAADVVAIVRFDEDPDSPCFPFPPCAILASLGLEALHTRIDAAQVQAVLLQLAEDLTVNARYALWPSSAVKLAEARLWDEKAGSLQAQRAQTGFHSAKEMAADAYGEGRPLALGAPVDLRRVDTAGTSTENDHQHEGRIQTEARPKKPHARPGPELQALLSKVVAEREAYEEEARRKAAQVAEIKKRVHETATTEAAPGGGAPRKVVFASKRAAVAPLKPSAGGAAGKKKTKQSAADSRLLQSGIDAGAAVSCKPSKPPAAEIDVATLDVPVLAAAGKLDSLTIPQLKAYCRSVKLPVGGKKGDLVMRIKGQLGIAEQ